MSGSPAPLWQGKIVPVGNAWALFGVTIPSALARHLADSPP